MYSAFQLEKEIKGEPNKYGIRNIDTDNPNFQNAQRLSDIFKARRDIFGESEDSIIQKIGQHKETSYILNLKLPIRIKS